jgi:lysophospholipase L1-like esterase
MITVFFDDRLCFANYAESGESANSFISAGRLKKIMTQIKPGDYVLVEFGHNDQKQKGEGKGAYLSYWKSLTGFIDQAREKKAIPVLITPTQRRSFGDDGRIVDTHEDYPQAMRDLAREKQVPLIDLHQMTRVLYEALGTEGSKKAFVHYPAGSFPGQNQDLADNTHFNPYGAYQIAKCVVMGMKQLGLPLVQFLREEVVYDPAFPDDPGSFNWWPSPYVELQKPEGN